jgi:hypothetical protein
MGNHDLWADNVAIESALESAGVMVLSNQCRRLPHPFDSISIVGLDDPSTGRDNHHHALDAIDDSTFPIALCHSPDVLHKVASTKIPLMLCGHTHGGQIATPWGPIVVPGQVGKVYSSGLHQYESTTLFVSRGVGNTEMPIRTFAPPDIAIFEV